MVRLSQPHESRLLLLAQQLNCFSFNTTVASRGVATSPPTVMLLLAALTLVLCWSFVLCDVPVAVWEEGIHRPMGIALDGNLVAFIDPVDRAVVKFHKNESKKEQTRVKPLRIRYNV